jgi:hypothetical protein
VRRLQGRVSITGSTEQPLLSGRSVGSSDSQTIERIITTTMKPEQAFAIAAYLVACGAFMGFLMLRMSYWK